MNLVSMNIYLYGFFCEQRYTDDTHNSKSCYHEKSSYQHFTFRAQNMAIEN